MDQLASIIPLLLIVAVFYLFVMRPMQRQRKQVAELQQALKVGDRVVLVSGIYAVISTLAEDRATVEIADGVRIEVSRGAIGAVDPTSLATHDDLDSLDGLPEAPEAGTPTTHDEK